MLTICGTKTNVLAFKGAAGSGKSTCAKICSEMIQAKNQTLRFAETIKQFLPFCLNVDKKYCEDPSLKESIIPDLGISGRQFMQCFGDFFRFDLPKKCKTFKFTFPPELESKDKSQSNEISFFTFLAMKKMQGLISEGILPICDDLRFLCESILIQRLGGLIFEVERSEPESVVIEEKKVNEEEVKQEQPTLKTGKKRRRKTAAQTSWYVKKKRALRTTGKSKVHISETEHEKIQADFKILNNGSLEDLRELLRQFLQNELVGNSLFTLTIGGCSITRLNTKKEDSEKMSQSILDCGKEQNQNGTVPELESVSFSTTETLVA